MKHTKEEILNALQIIKDECQGTRCQECPLRNRFDDCKIFENRPEHWEIKNEEEDVWRAFKE